MSQDHESETPSTAEYISRITDDLARLKLERDEALIARDAERKEVAELTRQIGLCFDIANDEPGWFRKLGSEDQPTHLMDAIMELRLAHDVHRSGVENACRNAQTAIAERAQLKQSNQELAAADASLRNALFLQQEKCHELAREKEELAAQNAALREALKWYVDFDNGSIATKALALPMLSVVARVKEMKRLLIESRTWKRHGFPADWFIAVEKVLIHD